MRELLFRGKTLDDPEWVYGYYVRQYEAHIIYFKEIDENGFIHRHIYPETIGQYTGLRDRNGRKIFEGDIVKCSDGENYQVVFEQRNNSAYFGLATTENDTWVFEDIITSNLAIVGNIYDNPELLKESAE